MICECFKNCLAQPFSSGTLLWVTLCAYVDYCVYVDPFINNCRWSWLALNFVSTLEAQIHHFFHFSFLYSLVFSSPTAPSTVFWAGLSSSAFFSEKAVRVTLNGSTCVSALIFYTFISGGEMSSSGGKAVVKQTEWWSASTISDQCGQNPVSEQAASLDSQWATSFEQ